VFKVTLCFLLILSFSFTGCQKSRVQNLQQRLDAFRNTLPQNLRTEFDSGNYEEVVKGIDSLLQVNEGFKEDFAKMKAEEAIDVFTPQEVVDFFKTYFVEEIEKEKTRK
jgi:type I restriction-modification system DNA methylase subunit